MENARKLADCYFYYYSTCTKGEACNFRHEPEALGCESMCFYWQQGKCFDQHCKLRHMELRKNRKQIPCYWETQPGGCRKKHCSFQHKNPQARIDGIAPSQPGVPMQSGRELQQQGVNRETGEGPPASSAGGAPGLHQGATAQPTASPTAAHNTHAPNWQRQVTMEPVILRGATLEGAGQHGGMPPLAPLNPMSPMAPINAMTPLAAAYSALQPVDSLVVNFEEESDSESVTGSGCSPLKNSLDDGKHSVDLIRLEQIQEETAAFYSYDFITSNLLVPHTEDKTEIKLAKRKLPLEYESLTLDEINGLKGGMKQSTSDNFRVLSLNEIRERKKLKVQCNNSPNGESNQSAPDMTQYYTPDIDYYHQNSSHVSIISESPKEQILESPDRESRRIKLKRKCSSNNCESGSESNIITRDIMSSSAMNLGKLKKYGGELENGVNNCNIDEDDRNNCLINSALSNAVNDFSNSSVISKGDSCNNSSDAILEMTTLSNSVPDLVSCCTKNPHGISQKI